MISQCFFRSDSRRDVLQLLLDELFGLGVVEVVQVEGQVLFGSMFFPCSVRILLLESLVFLLHHIEIL